jgi:protein gp37
MKETDIQWCDSTVNPIMGCAGCELYPAWGTVLKAIDGVVGASEGEGKKDAWRPGMAKSLYRDLIQLAYDAIPEEQRKPGHKWAVTNTNLWHLRERFVEAVKESHGTKAAEAARGAIEREITCYAAKLHLNKGLSIVNPGRSANTGFAPTFEQVTRYEERVREAAQWEDLLGKSDPDRPWIDRLPRLIFLSDMGDALSRESDFPFLKQDVIEPIQSEEGRRHLWLWLTKRPDWMVKLADQLGGLPDNLCAMTTVTSRKNLNRVDALRRVKAKVRGLSIEPLWERLPPQQLNLQGIDWVIVGGESGSKVQDTRPFEIEWAEELKDHCQKKGVAFFLKQLGRVATLGGERVHLTDSHGGDWMEWPDAALRVREFPSYFAQYRAGEVVGDQGLRRKRPGGLTSGEANEFKRLDKVVGAFARDTIHAADALYQIRDRKLYRGKFKTFSDYCESVHQMSRQYANRLITAGRIRSEMAPIVSNLGIALPEKEAQLRELGRVKDPQMRAEILRLAHAELTEQGGDAAAGRPVHLTAKLLREIQEKQITGTEAKPLGAKAGRGATPSQRLAKAREVVGELEKAISEGNGREIRKLVRGLRSVLGE